MSTQTDPTGDATAEPSYDAATPGATADPTAGAPAGDRVLAWLLVVAGAIGFVAAFVLTVEKIRLVADPDYVPSCSLNPILSCGSVMSTDQAEVFGFPNSLIGIGAFAVVVATGAALLAGARLARWYWLGLQLGVTLGLAAVAWLAFQSLYRIGALCPYCMVVWAVVIPLFVHVTRRNARAGVLGAGVQRSGVVRVLGEWHVVVVASLYLLVLALAVVEFWSYWSTLL